MAASIRWFLGCVTTGLMSLGVAIALEEVPPGGGKAPRPESAPVAIKREVNPLRDGPAKVVVIPVHDQIAKPVLYVLRRGFKEAIADQADLVVIDMETPGGSLEVTFDILEAIEKFDGATATFVNDEAISAGAFISAMTDDIYFAPNGVIGAAAPVMSTGGEIDETMKQKIVSYLRARIRAISEGHAYRGQVISAMIDSDYVLEIEGTVLKEEGELLSLTATEAAQTYGDPAEPLLAAGIAEDVADLLNQRFGEDGYELISLEMTWSEDLAATLNGFAPILMGLGFLGLFIEFKTPGFGVFGILGGLCLIIVFFGHNVAGLSGHEPILVFGLGILLVLTELLFFPGVVVVALTGVMLMLGSLIWSMADVWPNEPFTFSSGVLLQPVQNLMMGLVIAVVLGAAVLRLLPKGWFWDKMVLGAAVGDGTTLAGRPEVPSLVGATGVAATDLFPSGQVEIAGQRYEAKVEVGALGRGAPVVVCEQAEFGLVVEPVPEDES